MTSESRSGENDQESGGVTVGNVEGGIHGSILAGRDVIQKITNVFTGGPSDARDRRNQLVLLEKVRSFWIEGVLEKSVHSVAMISLGKEAQADAVERPWEMVLETPGQEESRRLPAGQRILDVFEEMGRALLILGEPGSGKTITLLELARDAIARAEQDATQPIPVVFVLSSWAEKSLSLIDWLTEELNTRYQIPQKIGRAWIENNDLLLLLDGLDEVEASRRPACVEAINAFRRDYGLAAIAMCSRTEEYRALATHLKLQGAIQLMPLTPQQIREYLAAAGLASLGTVMQNDAALQELAQSPLMLSVMSLAYQGLPGEALQGEQLVSIESRRDHLFATYVDRMFKRRRGDQRYTAAQSLGWLSWLARRMALHSQSVFFLEQMQPSWLSTRAQRWFYVLSSRLAGAGAIAVALLLLGLGWGKAFSFDPAAVLMGWLPLLIGCLGAGCAMGWVDGRRLGRAEGAAADSTVRKREVRRSAFLKVLTTGLLAVLGFGLGLVVLGLIPVVGWLVLGSALLFLGFVGCVWWLALGATIFLGFGLIFGLRRAWSSGPRDIQTVEGLVWSPRRSLVPVLAGVVICGVTLVATSLTRASAAQLWDAEGKLIARLDGDTSEVLWAGFNRDGRRIVTVPGDGPTKLRDGQDGTPIASLTGGDHNASLTRFSPDGTRILTRGSGDARLWDSEDGRLVGTISDSFSQGFFWGFAPDGTRYVTGKGDLDSDARLWNAQDAALIGPLKGTVCALAGERIVTVASDGAARLWDSRSGALIAILERELMSRFLVFMSPEGTRIATVDEEGTARLWNAQDGKLIAPLEGEVEADASMSFNASGSRIEAHGDGGTARLWNGNEGKLIAVLAGTQGGFLRFSPDGARLATTGREGTVQLWNAEDGKLVARLDVTGVPNGLLTMNAKTIETYPLFDTAGTRIVTVDKDGGAQLWNAKNGRLIRTLEGWLDTTLDNFKDTFDAFFSPDGRRLATVSPEGLVRLWNGEDGTLVGTIEGVGGSKDSDPLAFSADGTKIVTVSAHAPVDRRPLSALWLALGLLIGLFAGLRSAGVRETKTFPNQGIWLSLRNSVVAGLIGGLVLALISGLLLWFNGALAAKVSVLWGVFGFFAVLAALWYGGLDVIQHFLLRLILSTRKQTAWNQARFLDHAAERILLRKVGGGYIFIHRLLLEYFAGRTEP